MSFKKPCRIHNATPTGIPAGFSGNDNKINATLTEYKDRYELRIRIPHTPKRDFAICIKDGILIVYENAGRNASDNRTVLASFLLPANAQQNKAQGFSRNYGLKVIMPIAVPDGKIIKVPIIREAKEAVPAHTC